MGDRGVGPGPPFLSTELERESPLLSNETLITFNEAARHLPRVNGKRVHVSALWRWATSGVQGVRLETRRLGRRYFTSLEALDRFSARLADASAERQEARKETATSFRASIRPRRCRDRERAMARAREHLARAGI